MRISALHAASFPIFTLDPIKISQHPSRHQENEDKMQSCVAIEELFGLPSALGCHCCVETR